MENLAKKNGTTVSVCGYVTGAMCEYLSEQENVTEETFKNINFHLLAPYIEKVMQTITKNRRLEIKKFMNKMNENDKKCYLTDWVANF